MSRSSFGDEGEGNFEDVFDNIEDIESRISALELTAPEERLRAQEAGLASLSQIVFTQGATIDRLLTLIEKMQSIIERQEHSTLTATQMITVLAVELKRVQGGRL